MTDTTKREPNDELRKLMKELIVEGAKYGYNNSSNTGSYELTPNQDKYADELVNQGMKEIEQYAYEYAKSLIGKQEKSKTTKPRPLITFIDDGDEGVALNGGSVRKIDYYADTRNLLRTEQHNRNDQLRGKME